MSNYEKPLKNLYVNDMAGYSETLNKCYLTSTNDLSTDDLENLISHLKHMTNFLSKKQNKEPFISKYWAPQDDNNIQENERVYFTHQNACNIDMMMYYINNFVEEKYKALLMGPFISSMFNSQ